MSRRRQVHRCRALSRLLLSWFFFGHEVRAGSWSACGSLEMFRWPRCKPCDHLKGSLRTALRDAVWFSVGSIAGASQRDVRCRSITTFKGREQDRDSNGGGFTIWARLSPVDPFLEFPGSFRGFSRSVLLALALSWPIKRTCKETPKRVRNIIIKNRPPKMHKKNVLGNS